MIGMRATAVLLSLLLGSAAASSELPDESVFHLGGEWQDQDGAAVSLADMQGKVRLVSFVYSYCEHTCPTIVARLRMIDRGVAENIRDELAITLVSLDPERDTPERLAAYMKEQSLDPERWSMLSGTPDNTRALAALFGVRYRPMGTSDFAHSNVITVVDRDGVIQYQMKGLNEDVERVVDAVAEAIANR